MSFSFSGFASSFKCEQPRLNFSKMKREMEKLKKDQKFIFPEKNTTFTQVKETIPEDLNKLLSKIQIEAFGKEILKLRAVRDFNVSGDSFNKSIDYDPKLIESINKDNGYNDPETLLQFIFAQGVSHFIQDFIAINSGTLRTTNGIVLITDSTQHFYKEQLESFVLKHSKKKIMEESDELETVMLQNIHKANVEVDGYAYLLLKKLNYKKPNAEDLKKLLVSINNTVLSKEELFAPERCGFEQRLSLLEKIRDEK